MIVGSLLLILVAVGLLVAGVLSGSNALIICCIIVVVLAAIVLVLGVKQSAATGAFAEEDVDAGAGAGELTGEYSTVRRSGSSRSDSGFPVRQSSRRRSAEQVDEPEMVDVAAAGGSRRAARAAASGGTGPVVDDRGIPSQSADRYTDTPTYESFEAPEYETATFDAPVLDDPVTEAPAFDQPYEAGSYADPGYTGSGYAGTGHEDPGSGYEGYAYSYEAQAPADQNFDDTRGFEQPGGFDESDDEADFAAAGFDEEPADEPSAQMVTPGNAARVAMLTTDVLVVDGRPRYHVLGCVHLHNKETEPIPVGEAVELGFTPCALCEPDSALLADARRV